jgi:hypothetical protein
VRYVVQEFLPRLALPFRNVGRNRYGGTAHLRADSKPLVFWEVIGVLIDSDSQFDSFLPNPEISVGSDDHPVLRKDLLQSCGIVVDDA